MRSYPSGPPSINTSVLKLQETPPWQGLTALAVLAFYDGQESL